MESRASFEIYSKLMCHEFRIYVFLSVCMTFWQAYVTHRDMALNYHGIVTKAYKAFEKFRSASIYTFFAENRDICHFLTCHMSHIIQI